MRILGNLVRKTLSSFSTRASEVTCTYVKPGIYRCCDDKYVVALYKIKSWSFSVYDLSHLEYIYNLKRFLELFRVEHCRTIFFTDVEPVDVDRYISKLNRKIQAKLVELELDKSNTKLQTYVEKLNEVRRKVLMGIKPAKLLNIIAITCDNSVDPKELGTPISDAKNLLNIDLDPIVDKRRAEAIINFCS